MAANLPFVHADQPAEQPRQDYERLQAILVASADGIAFLDHNACIIEANTVFGRIFQVEPMQLVGVECLKLFQADEDDKRDVLCSLQGALLQKQTLSSIEVDVPVGETVRLLNINISHMLSGSLVVVRDITDARDAMQTRAKFLSLVTHELRSPLNAINGYLDLVLVGVAGDLNNQQREFIQRARAGSEHLFTILEDLLLVSRAEAGQLRLNRAIIELREVVLNAVEEMELTANNNGIAVEIDIPADIPALYADSVRLQQVLRNLLSNALRFTRPGERVLVSARVEQNNADLPAWYNTVALEVHDSGCGIDPELHERIFERFFQASGVLEKCSSGQGLGLAVVKMIMELHGGYVKVKSACGQGSTFICGFPALPE